MGKNNPQFSMDDAKRLAASPSGQQLLAMLRAQDQGQLQQIMDQISKGDYQSAGSALSGMLASPEAKALLRKLEEG